jgi:hypothetical protein
LGDQVNVRNINHHLNCEAAICAGDPNPNFKREVVWYPGERICKRKPFQRFQRRQVEINKLIAKGKFRHLDTPYTARDLETLLI